MKSTLPFFLLISFLSCNEPEVKPISYQFVIDTAFPYTANINLAKVYNGELYVSATINNISGIYKHERTNWKLLVKTEIVSDFILYQNNLYFSDFHNFFKVENSQPVKIASDIQILSFENHDEILYLSVIRFTIDQEEYSLIAYDGQSFKPVSKTESGHSMLSFNDNLYISGYPVTKYDGTAFSNIGLYGQSNFTYDNDGTIYIASYSNNVHSYYQVNKQGDFRQTAVGDSVFHSIEKVEYYNETLFIYLSNAEMFYLKNNRWEKIETPEDISFGVLVKYNEKLILFNNTSKRAYTLVQNQ